MKAHHNPDHPHNSSHYHTGRECIERGCTNPAGTAWSPWWCWRCNAERLDRVTGQLAQLTSQERGASRGE